MEDLNKCSSEARQMEQLEGLRETPKLADKLRKPEDIEKRGEGESWEDEDRMRALVVEGTQMRMLCLERPKQVFVQVVQRRKKSGRLSLN